MKRTGSTKPVTIASVVLIAIAVGAISFFIHDRSAPPHVVVLPATAPSTAPATAPAAEAASPPEDLLGVVRSHDPDYPTTQELDMPGDYDQAAHLVLHQPVYLCPMSNLWITDPHARPTATVLANAGDSVTHVVRDLVLFAHWQHTDAGKWIASLIRRNDAGGFELVQSNRVTPLAGKRNWNWNRAIAWEDKIVVPTDRGVSVFSINDPQHEFYQPLADDSVAAEKISSPCVLFDNRGILAWMPWESGLVGSHGAARFVDGKWSTLDSSTGWPDKILHLMPLLDGSVMQLIPNDDGSIKLAMTGVAAAADANIDEARIAQLVTQLSDADQVNRDAAYAELTRYGPGIFPILQKTRDDQPPAAQSRIDELLNAKLHLTLGPIELQPGPITTAARLRDGGVVLYADGGVSISRGGEEKPITFNPAWLSIRPGYPVQVLPPKLAEELQTGKQQIWAFKNEWIVSNDTEGPRWFVGNYLSPLVHDNETKFNQFVGIDLHGRWIMRTTDPAGPTLIVDPNLPDTTPHLPVWEIPVSGGSSGWTNTNWPAIKRPGVFVLSATGWRAMDEKTEKFFQKESEIPPAVAAATTSVSTPQPSTTQATDLILIDTDGTRYFDGVNAIRIQTRDGKTTSWNLPPADIGSGDVWLFHCGEDRFFLFNQPGRVLRLRRTPGKTDAFKIEATFTHQIPISNPERIWLDPAGRLVISYDGDKLAVLFPTGRVPPEIQQMMPPPQRGE